MQLGSDFFTTEAQRAQRFFIINFSVLLCLCDELFALKQIMFRPRLHGVGGFMNERINLPAWTFFVGRLVRVKQRRPAKPVVAED